jgi:hypothetical protein
LQDLTKLSRQNVRIVCVKHLHLLSLYYQGATLTRNSGATASNTSANTARPPTAPSAISKKATTLLQKAQESARDAVLDNYMQEIDGMSEAERRPIREQCAETLDNCSLKTARDATLVLSQLYSNALQSGTPKAEVDALFAELNVDISTFGGSSKA